MIKGKSGTLLLEEFKDILVRTGVQRNMAMDLDMGDNLDAHYSLLWYRSHLTNLLGYGGWIYRTVSTLEDKGITEADIELLIPIKGEEFDGALEAAEHFKSLKKEIETVLMAYSEYIGIHRQLEVLTEEFKKHLYLADANLNQMAKRGADLDLKNLE